jgi:hypothetical protein
VKKGLCVRHHKEITMLNGQQARKYHVHLSNNFRWWIWYAWLRGELKVRRTRKALEWTDAWDRPVVPQLEYPQTPEAQVIPSSAEPIAETKKRTRRKRRQRKRKPVGARVRKAEPGKKPAKKRRRGQVRKAENSEA